ncbi:sphingosine N-acyltransferase lag1 [Geranomyces variabilis]|nr:sphingosine N-acyltransferase lag1 [Geranomyces variabilis]
MQQHLFSHPPECVLDVPTLKAQGLAEPSGPPPAVWLPDSVLRYLNYDFEKGTCRKHPNDVLIALAFAVLFIALRSYLYKNLFPVLAKRWHVPKAPGPRLKFSEQTWLLMCHTASFFGGVVLISGTPAESALWGNWDGLKQFWIGYPFNHRAILPVFKIYYLAILGYWLHHVFALGVEGVRWRMVQRMRARGETNLPYAQNRSDFWPLALHHAVTVSLIIVSYVMNFTRGGLVVIVLLDVADIFLPLAKILKYAGHNTICDAAFAVFTILWVYTRHYVLGRVCVSIWYDTLTCIPAEAREWDPWVSESFWDMKVYWMFVIFFGTLQVLLVYWLAMIVKVVLKVVRGGPAEDVRSDDEDEDEEPLINGPTPSTKNIASHATKDVKRVTKRAVAKAGVELRSGDWEAVKEGEFRRRR